MIPIVMQLMVYSILRLEQPKDSLQTAAESSDGESQ